MTIIETLTDRLKRRSFFRPWLDNSKNGDREFYTLDHIKFCLRVCALEDGDPYQRMLNEFIRDTTELWSALLDGRINDSQDEVIERLVLRICDLNEQRGVETHQNTLRLAPSYNTEGNL